MQRLVSRIWSPAVVTALYSLTLFVVQTVSVCIAGVFTTLLCCEFSSCITLLLCYTDDLSSDPSGRVLAVRATICSQHRFDSSGVLLAFSRRFIKLDHVWRASTWLALQRLNWEFTTLPSVDTLSEAR